MTTIILLTLSNIFMTFAWYGHLKFRDVALWQVILISWLIALPEYALYHFNLKIISFKISQSNFIFLVKNCQKPQVV